MKGPIRGKLSQLQATQASDPCSLVDIGAGKGDLAAPEHYIGRHNNRFSYLDSWFLASPWTMVPP